jgi:hypothetical protein
MFDTQERIAAEAPAARERGVRWWMVAAVGVLALAIGVLIGSMLGDGGETSDVATPGGVGALTSEPEQAIIDYNTAWEQQDPEALQAVVTDDFVEEYWFINQSDDQVAVSSDSWGATEAASYAASSDYQIELSGEAIVVGDGPWYVSVAESQTGGGYGYEGTTSYVVVDDDGTLKLARKSWVGSRQPLTE